MKHLTSFARQNSLHASLMEGEADRRPSAAPDQGLMLLLGGLAMACPEGTAGPEDSADAVFAGSQRLLAFDDLNALFPYFEAEGVSWRNATWV